MLDLTHADVAEVVWDPISSRLWINTEHGCVLNLTHADTAEVVWDPISSRLWINTEHGCVGRIYNVKEFHYRETPTNLEDSSSP